MEGFGIYKYPNGNEYVGFYVRDKREGYGIFTELDKSGGTKIYTGSWFDGK